MEFDGPTAKPSETPRRTAQQPNTARSSGAEHGHRARGSQTQSNRLTKKSGRAAPPDNGALFHARTNNINYSRKSGMRATR